MDKIIVFIATSLVLAIVIGVYSAIVMSGKWSRIEEEWENKKSLNIEEKCIEKL